MARGSGEVGCGGGVRRIGWGRGCGWGLGVLEGWLRDGVVGDILPGWFELLFFSLIFDMQD